MIFLVFEVRKCVFTVVLTHSPLKNIKNHDFLILSKKYAFGVPFFDTFGPLLGALWAPKCTPKSYRDALGHYLGPSGAYVVDLGASGC